MVKNQPDGLLDYRPKVLSRSRSIMSFDIFTDDDVKRKKADRVMILDDRDNDHKDNPSGPVYPCADEIVKEILGQVSPGFRRHEARVNFSASNKKQIRNHQATRNRAHSTQFTVKRPRPPLSLFT